MKSIRQDLDDSLRPEYQRSDFGELVQGKHALTQIEFAELVDLLLACIGEDEGVKFINSSPGNRAAGHKPGDWTYELDNTNQITLRYWVNEFRSIEERVSNPPFATTPQEGSDLQNLILKHVRTLKATLAVWVSG